MFLGIVEEVGEAAHAILKHKQGIRGFDDVGKFEAHLKDALGDIFMYWLQVCKEYGWDPENIIKITAQHILKRDDYESKERT